MKLEVWAEKSNGMMEHVGTAVIADEHGEESVYQAVAESIREKNAGAYTQLWVGIECVASAGSPEFQ